LVRAHTGRRDVVCLEAAYHGNTPNLIDVSPYKHARKGGEGAPSHVHVAPLPDGYRGRHREGDLGALYGDEVAAMIRRLAGEGRAPGVFLAESLPGCGGQIELPEGYLRRAYDAIRSVGGVAIADEVQVGFGRVGDALWGYELGGVVPDIVTLGKPIGNGHPLSAVITTPEIARSFETGMEFFNTFGGNPVSCAIGLAVLDVIRDEGLQERARAVGAHFRRGLAALGEHFPLIGQVRGRGLFLGAELVTDRDRREPAAAAARYVVNRCRELGVLLSVDGPDEDVLKIKPPLSLSVGEVDRALEVLARVLAESPLASEPGGKARGTP
jgi:4-aminobutyrate aminotransferase-like enzyme